MDASHQLWRDEALGRDWPCHGADSETETQGGQLDESQTASTCEELVQHFSRRLVAQSHRRELVRPMHVHAHTQRFSGRLAAQKRKEIYADAFFWAACCPEK